MSGSNFFDNSDEGEFRDQPDEVSGQSAIEILQQQMAGPSLPRRAPINPELLKSPGEDTRPDPRLYIDESDQYDVTDELQDEEEDYTAVLSDARLRLEQGRLYEMIMNHDLFEGMDSDPNAVKHVQRQIRKFAKEQMEIMLGMRKETAKVERLEIDFPFNAVEVKVLKMVADKASGGASQQSDRYVPEVTRTTEEVEVVGTPKRQGLNSIVGKKQPQKAPAKPAPVVKQAPVAAPVKSALRQTATAPVARKPRSNTPDHVIVEGEIVTREMIDSTFEPDYKPLEKPIHEMKSEELLRRNQEASQRRHKTVKSPNAMPMPTYEQESMLHQTRMMETAGANNAVTTIMSIMNAQNQKK